MEGQTNCALCEYESRNNGSFKQHMESKHNVFNMPIVQVLTHQVERVDKLESEIKAKEQLLKQAEVDLDTTKEALQTERESLDKKKKVFDELITSQKKKTAEESKIVEELKYTKGLLRKAHQYFEAQTNILNAKLEKVEASEVSTQTVAQLNEVLTQTVSQINEISTQTISELFEVLNLKKRKVKISVKKIQKKINNLQIFP